MGASVVERGGCVHQPRARETGTPGFGTGALLRAQGSRSASRSLYPSEDDSRTEPTESVVARFELGVFGGTSLGGMMLALGGFPLLGLFCLGVAIIAAAVLRLKVRESAEFLAQRVLRQDHMIASSKARMGGCISLPSLR